MLVGGTRRDVIIPAAAANLIEDDAGETMIMAYRPAAWAGKRRENNPDQAEPVRLERAAMRRHSGDMGLPRQETGMPA
jgi:hypothetical protein